MKQQILGLLLFATVSAFAASIEGRIISVERQLAMASGQDSPSLYWFDIGMNQGVRDQMNFSVYRAVPVVNAVLGEAVEVNRVLVGQMKVVFVGAESSAAQFTSRSPMADTLNIPVTLVGDTVRAEVVELMQPPNQNAE